MLKALLIKRVVAIGFSVLVSTAIPHMVQDKPRIKWVWDKLGPMVVDAAEDRIETHLNIPIDQEE